jgi:hypothetical protein
MQPAAARIAARRMIDGTPVLNSPGAGTLKSVAREVWICLSSGGTKITDSRSLIGKEFPAENRFPGPYNF